MLTYILEVSLCWAVFYGLYWLLLSRETFFHFNRGYLLSTLILGVVIPLVEWQWLFAQPEVMTIYLQPITFGVQTLEVTVTAAAVTPKISFFEVLRWIYVVGILFFAIRLVIGVTQIARLYFKSERRNFRGFRLICTDQPHQPFSFFRLLFLSKKIELNPEDEAQILRHELAHIRGWHSVDVLLTEILTAIFWCSPLIYFCRRSLRTVHEYIADASVLRTTQRKQYGHLLIRQSQSGPALAIANHFHSQLKKRILMMLQPKSSRRHLAKYLLALPLLAILVMAFAKKENWTEQFPTSFENIIGSDYDEAKIRQTLQEGMSKDDETIFYEKTGNIIPQKEAQPIAIVPTDTVPFNFNASLVTLQQQGQVADKPIFEIYYPDGKMETLTDVTDIGKIVNVGDISKIDVYKQPNALIKIWLKGSKADEMPLFSGCSGEATAEARQACSNDKLMRFIASNLNYPKAARQLGITGKVMGKIVINDEGEVTAVSVLKGIGDECDEEVIRVLKMLPKWTPALKNGKPMTMDLTIPVQFKLQGEDKQYESERQMVFDTEKRDLKLAQNEGVVVVGLKPQEDKPYTFVEEQPQFPDGTAALFKWIASNLKYPAAARENGIEGTSYIGFVIEKDGSVTNVEVKRGIENGKILDEEAMRVAKMMPKWIPGKQDGKPVRVLFTLPIKFKLGYAAPAAPIIKAGERTLALENFKITPNPTSGVVNLRFKASAKPTVITVYDMQGKELFTTKVNDGNFNSQMDLSNAPKGTLILSIRQEEKVFTEKIILQ